MPSPKQAFSVQEWSEQLDGTLETYSEKIESCISLAEWETLTIVLESRQAFLQHLFSQHLPDECLGTLRQVAQLILLQDSQFRSRVEAEKRIIAQRRMEMENSKRAVQAYNNH